MGETKPVGGLRPASHNLAVLPTGLRTKGMCQSLYAHLGWDLHSRLGHTTDILVSPSNCLCCRTNIMGEMVFLEGVEIG